MNGAAADLVKFFTQFKILTVQKKVLTNKNLYVILYIEKEVRPMDEVIFDSTEYYCTACGEYFTVLEDDCYCPYCGTEFTGDNSWKGE